MESKDAVAALGALAQDTRLALFRILVEAGPDGMAAGQLAERLRVPAATLSFHLAQLSHAGLVIATREGRSIIYAADFAAMTTLVGFLTDQCCQGRPELCAPKTKPAKARHNPARASLRMTR
jgi:ArsR family transcriptional regulator, arsenate/arsenite/antimonite-responsive transcriptional repressor